MSLTSTQLAAALGISRQRVNELGRKGKIHREADGNWDPAKVAAALGRNLDLHHVSPARDGQRPAPPVSPEPPSGDFRQPRLGAGTFADAQLQHERAKAVKATLEAKRLSGELVPAAEAEAAWAAAGIMIRDAVMGLGARVTNRLPAEWRAELHTVLDDEVRKLLRLISDAIRNRKTA